MTPGDLALASLAAIGAGFVNALAGGGTLVSFPVLTTIGLPAMTANVTSAVALGPGYLGAVAAQRRDLCGQGARLRVLVPVGALGGLAGALLLLESGERTFRALVPFLILLASGLLAAQDQVRAWIGRRAGGQPHGDSHAIWRAVLPVAFVGVYGGYFAAGFSVLLLATLGVMVDDTLTRLNALKQPIALAISAGSVVLFATSGQVVWPTAIVMAVGAIAGGAIGGRVAGIVHPATLRWSVVAIGVVVAIMYLLG